MNEKTIDENYGKIAPVYVYDGSFDGLLCCLFSAYELKETPAAVTREYGGFLPCRNISSVDERAARVRRGIITKIGEDALRLGEHAYLSEREGIDAEILKFWKLGFTVGKKVYGMLYDDSVAAVRAAAKYTMNERHKIIQFLRFSDSNGALTSVISPNANILPLLAGHFIDRFPRESFLIYDSARGMALVYGGGGKSVIIPVEEYEQPAPDETEQKYRDLFRTFYETIEIKERHNEKCRMSHMPKRFWKNMTEFTGGGMDADRIAGKTDSALPPPSDD